MARQLVGCQILDRESKLKNLLPGLFVVFAAGCHTAPRLESYPLGIYAVPVDEMPEVRAAGFNLVTGPARPAYLDAAQRNGLKVLVHVGLEAGNDLAPQRIRPLVHRLDRHPALWAWYLVDEPDLNRISPDRVASAYRMIRHSPAHKPLALTLYQGYEAFHYVESCDILLIDRYPIPWLPMANFPQHVQMARLAAGRNKPVIAVIQAFDWSHFPKLMPGETGLRPPTYAEIRCMVFAALAQKANGLFFYCYDDGVWRITDHPDVWEDLKLVVREVHRKLPLFEGEHRWWPYRHSFGDPNRRFNRALQASIIPALLRVTRGNPLVKPGDYILAVNTTPEPHVYSLSLPEGSRAAVPVLEEDRYVLNLDGWIDDHFDPFAVHVYGPL